MMMIMNNTNENNEEEEEDADVDDDNNDNNNDNDHNDGGSGGGGVSDGVGVVDDNDNDNDCDSAAADEDDIRVPQYAHTLWYFDTMSYHKELLNEKKRDAFCHMLYYISIAFFVTQSSILGNSWGPFYYHGWLSP